MILAIQILVILAITYLAAKIVSSIARFLIFVGLVKMFGKK